MWLQFTDKSSQVNAALFWKTATHTCSTQFYKSWIKNIMCLLSARPASLGHDACAREVIRKDDVNGLPRPSYLMLVSSQTHWYN